MSVIFNLSSLIRLWFIAAICIAKEYYDNTQSRRRHHKCPVYNTGSDRVAIVTGGSRGIGLEVVKNLLSEGIKVIIGSSSSSDRCAQLQQKLQEEHPNCKIEVWSLNLMSMKSVKEFANRFLASQLPLHLLINNAGIMFVPYETTEDGMESHFSVNYLGHCLLTKMLLPSLAVAGNRELHSRIINVTSCVYATARLDINDLQGKERYSPYHSYMQSKLAQLMFTVVLQEYMQKEAYNVSTYAVHPGIVNTDLHKHVWWAPKAFNNLYKTPEEGAANILCTSLSPDLEGCGGSYVEKGCVTPTTHYSMNRNLQKQLWDETWKLLQPWLN